MVQPTTTKTTNNGTVCSFPTHSLQDSEIPFASRTKNFKNDILGSYLKTEVSNFTKAPVSYEDSHMRSLLACLSS